MLFDQMAFFFFNDTATTEIYTLSLHDALPICRLESGGAGVVFSSLQRPQSGHPARSEEHTSELQSPDHLVCRLLLEKKKTSKAKPIYNALNKAAATPESTALRCSATVAFGCKI